MGGGRGGGEEGVTVPAAGGTKQPSPRERSVMREVRTALGERHVFVADAPEGAHKLFQVQFGRRDGSLFIHFPYFRKSHGIASIVRLPAHSQLPAHISLAESGRITAQKVKFTHHRDGEVHFSQDGRVQTVVRKHGIPLATANRHIFTVECRGLSEFQVADKVRDLTSRSPRRSFCAMRFAALPYRLKVVAYYYTTGSLLQRIDGPAEGVVGPGVALTNPEGEHFDGLILTPPPGSPGSGFALILAVQGFEREAGDTSPPGLLFIGGFDPPSTVRDGAVDTKFLALSYPVDEPEELIRRLGSMDLDPRPLLGSA
jgi:hypothetical protein